MEVIKLEIKEEMQERLEVCDDKIAELEANLKDDLKMLIIEIKDKKRGVFNLNYLRSISRRINDTCMDLGHWYLMKDVLENIAKEVNKYE